SDLRDDPGNAMRLTRESNSALRARKSSDEIPTANMTETERPSHSVGRFGDRRVIEVATAGDGPHGRSPDPRMEIDQRVDMRVEMVCDRPGQLIGNPGLLAPKRAIEVRAVGLVTGVASLGSECNRIGHR